MLRCVCVSLGLSLLACSPGATSPPDTRAPASAPGGGSEPVVLGGGAAEAGGGPEGEGPQPWIDTKVYDAAPQPESSEPFGAAVEGFTGTAVVHTKDGDGLERWDYAVGTGPMATQGSRVRIDYVGVLLDGTEFDSTHARNTPFEFELGTNRVIPGFERGLVAARVGMRRKLLIPPELGYGAQARGSIPAHAALIFYIEVLEVSGGVESLEGPQVIRTSKVPVEE